MLPVQVSGGKSKQQRSRFVLSKQNYFKLGKNKFVPSVTTKIGDKLTTVLLNNSILIRRKKTQETNYNRTIGVLADGFTVEHEKRFTFFLKKNKKTLQII